MANSHEGWDPELFVVPPNEDDLCSICEQVLEDAVETSCGHSFCEKCIKGWLSQRQVCPQDQKALSWEECRPMIRDRRRILDLKVKCPWCSNQMELRSLMDHKRTKCQKRPEDAEDDEKEPADEEKQEKEEHEYVIELVQDGDQKNNKADEEKKQREAEQQRDHLFAAQLQEQERQRGVSLGISARGGGPSGPGSPSRASVAQQPRAITPQVQLVRPMDQGGEPHVEEFGNEGGGGAVIEYYQADEFGEGLEGGNGNGARPDKQRNRPIAAKRRGCCGCSDRCWCCMCCFFWIILIILGVSIWFWGPSGVASRVGL